MTTERHSWRPVDLVAIATGEAEPATIGGIIYPGRRHVFSGEPESLKSLGAMALAVDVIRGGDAVVWIDVQENGARETLTRLRALGLADDETQKFVYLEPDEPIVADVAALIANTKPKLVVVDSTNPLLALHGLNPNETRDIDRLYATVVSPLRAHGAAIVLLDHLPKDRENRSKFAIGSERKIGAADVHLRFDVKQPLSRGGTGVVNLKTLKDRPGYLTRPHCGTFTFVSDAGTGAISFTLELAAGSDVQHHEPATKFRPTVLMERVSLYVERCAEPVSRRTVQAEVGGNAAAVRTAIDRLREEGHLRQTAGPRRSQLLTTIKPYRQADDSTECDQCDHSATKCNQDALAASVTSATTPYKGVALTVAHQGPHQNPSATNADVPHDVTPDVAASSPVDADASQTESVS